MWMSSLWRLVKFVVASALVVLSLQFILSVLTGTRVRTPPLTAEEHRLISPRTYEYLHNQPYVCQVRSPFLLLLVPVAPWEVAARHAVRGTWGSSGEDAMTLFFMGLSANEPQASLLQQSLQKEIKRHRDVIQMNFVDSYQNLTIKTLMMMNWVASHCPNASYAMKVDADIFVNVFYLLAYLRGSPRTSFITGSVIRDGRPRRDPNSKWYLSEEQYPGDSFPPYVSGAGYVFSTELAAQIVQASRFVRVIPMEDVYVGLCLQVLGVRPMYALSFLTLRNLFEIRKLEYDRCTFTRLLIANNFRPSELLQVWQDFSKSHADC
ncbi:beta-1,3-galactosyltransferase 1 [Gouania willdenowi]|uniref:Hexosyltransferase n=1 Tax=Gouania willdenowi TaxID=441366 RepID=A0A8C5NDT3_GOUWI|nr:beta-1,3-galactosyltransferase 1-like [Gouania willdenowi]